MPHQFPADTAHVASGVGDFVGVAATAEVGCLAVVEAFTELVEVFAELVDDFTELGAVLVDLKVAPGGFSVPVEEEVAVADTAEPLTLVVAVEPGVVGMDVVLRERYQLVLSVSPRHSPTVTPFQPLALI